MLVPHREWMFRVGARSAACAVALLSVVLCRTSPARAQSYKVIYNFPCGTGASEPYYAGVVYDKAGNFYGTTVVGGAYGLGTVFETLGHGTGKVLHSFAGAPSDGESPSAGLVRDSQGNLYGTTEGGGTSNNGAVFKVSADGTETILYSFAGKPDGSNPTDALILDGAGNLYGTTFAGGSFGYGTVFKLAPTETETVLHNFELGTTDGQDPFGGVVRDAAGNLYGTTEFGGAFNEGTVFELGKGKKLTVLHSFGPSPGDGAYPTAGPFRDSAGNLYGTTTEGGTGGGTVFKVDPTGTETVLFSFPGGNGGYAPAGGLVEDASGNLYGTTQLGGSAVCTDNLDGCGVVFQVSPAGVETVLHSFSGHPTDGTKPLDSLISDSAGNLYGTTWLGGKNGCGIVFSVKE